MLWPMMVFRTSVQGGHTHTHTERKRWLMCRDVGCLFCSAELICDSHWIFNTRQTEQTLLHECMFYITVKVTNWDHIYHPTLVLSQLFGFSLFTMLLKVKAANWGWLLTVDCFYLHLFLLVSLPSSSLISKAFYLASFFCFYYYWWCRRDRQWSHGKRGKPAVKDKAYVIQAL